MSPLFGLIAACIALLAWGFGDFAIQRSIRVLGIIPALFFIGIVGGLGLLPFVWHELPGVFENTSLIQLLALTAITTLVYAILLFASFQRGKLSIVEPVISLELPITIAISIIFIGEQIIASQYVLILIIFAGLVATVFRQEPKHWWNIFFKRKIFERGVLLAIAAAAFSALANVLTGVLSIESSPLVAIWGIHSSLALFCLIWMAFRSEVVSSFRIAIKNWKPVLAESLLDNIAWIAYAAAVTTIPISITIAITESYIALGALLGIIFNRERLQKHQYVGVAITIAAAVILGVMSEG